MSLGLESELKCSRCYARGHTLQTCVCMLCEKGTCRCSDHKCNFCRYAHTSREHQCEKCGYRGHGQVFHTCCCQFCHENQYEQCSNQCLKCLVNGHGKKDHMCVKCPMSWDHKTEDHKCEKCPMSLDHKTEDHKCEKCRMSWDHKTEDHCEFCNLFHATEKHPCKMCGIEGHLELVGCISLMRKEITDLKSQNESLKNEIAILKSKSE
ncbi:MAG: hypothetical protein Satyrvirus24_3 [Satyrvirus sp.]|uniref:Uncharacterized protein n=1 Tax=Satyrvirus sp. TaxID=2487771 RepID=A0A3G5AJD2_9VIRU|nr:MAG: hypothetical protein Satyrvirus24_3 [Satyrvirus sp.]